MTAELIREKRAHAQGIWDRVLRKLFIYYTSLCTLDCRPLYRCKRSAAKFNVICRTRSLSVIQTKNAPTNLSVTESGQSFPCARQLSGDENGQVVGAVYELF